MNRRKIFVLTNCWWCMNDIIDFFAIHYLWQYSMRLFFNTVYLCSSTFQIQNDLFYNLSKDCVCCCYWLLLFILFFRPLNAISTILIYSNTIFNFIFFLYWFDVCVGHAIISQVCRHLNRMILYIWFHVMSLSML